MKKSIFRGIAVLFLVVLFISPAFTMMVKEFESPNVIFKPLTAQKEDAEKVREILMNPEIMANAYGPRNPEWIKMLIHNQLKAAKTTPLGAFLMYSKKDHSFMGICGFKSGNDYTTFKEGPKNPEGNGDPYPEGGGLRKDGRTELGSGSVLLYPAYTSFRPEITSALIQYAFTEVPSLIGIDFGVQGTNKAAQEDMEQKKLPLVAPPYNVYRGSGYPVIKMFVYRCDRDHYSEHFPIDVKP